MNPNDAHNITKPLGYDEAKRKLNAAFKQKLCDALDNDCGDIDAMRQAYLHGDHLELGRLVSASMEIYEDEYGVEKATGESS
jgi:murein endopeptidase